MQITSNGWRAGITLDNFFGGGEEGWRGRRSLVMRGLSVILTLQPKFLDRFKVLRGPVEFEELSRLQ